MDLDQKLLDVLAEIKGAGSYATSGLQPFIFPGLMVAGFGTISFPILPDQAKQLIKVAKQAPFGKGKKTILDKNVRSGWEIDGKKVTFGNPDWESLLMKVLEIVKRDLGIEDRTVSAKMYKLLIYEKGDFFLPHKDSEKEKGMFGTLIIALPSRHTGGSLLIRFDGKEKAVNFSGTDSYHSLPYGAFYADCEHEVTPVKSGYRVCLVYNLIQQRGKEKIVISSLKQQVDKLTALFKKDANNSKPKIILLGHQYTPSNYSMEALKLDDRPKAEAILRAADNAGYYVKPALVTSYQIGDLVSDFYYDYRYDENGNETASNEGTMGDLFDDGIEIEHWMAGEVPPLKNLRFSEEDVISPVTLNEGEPIEKEAEGYTGNAGMEMTYWYHYGAVVLWPRKKQYEVLADLALVNQLEWMAYYNAHWQQVPKTEITAMKRIIARGLGINSSGRTINGAPLGEFLLRLQDEEFVKKKTVKAIAKVFGHIPIQIWLKLFEQYPAECFDATFEAVIFYKPNKEKLDETEDLDELDDEEYWEDLHDTFDFEYQNKPDHLGKVLSVLFTLVNHSTTRYLPFVSRQLQYLPDALRNIQLTKKGNGESVRHILKQLLLIMEKTKTADKQWLTEVIGILCDEMPRDYVNGVLLRTLLENGKKTRLSRKVMAVCKKDLEDRINNKPQPPATWTRPIPTTSRFKSEFAYLADFLASPTATQFDYKALKAHRSSMEYAIRKANVDLEMETIRKGSPQTLRLTKTTATYDRELKKWKEDVALLKDVDVW